MQAERETTTLQVAWSAYIEHLKTTRSPKRANYVHLAISPTISISLPRVENQRPEVRIGQNSCRPPSLFNALRLKELNAAKLAEWLQHESNERPSVAAHAYRLLRAFYLG